MTARYAVDLEVALNGETVETREWDYCAGCNARLHNGTPVTVIARLRPTGWDVEDVFGAHCAPENLDDYQQRGGEGLVLAECELALVMSRQESWLEVTHADVLEWIEPRD